jgi:hypothetical protein
MTVKANVITSISFMLALFSPPFLYVLIRFGAHGKMMGFLFHHMWLKTCLGQMLIYLDIWIIDWLANDPDKAPRGLLELAYGGFIINWFCFCLIINLGFWSFGRIAAPFLNQWATTIARADKRSSHDEGSGTGV